MKKNKQLIVFVKSPLPGKCKTRLIPFLNANEACEFYKSLIITYFENLKSLINIDITIYAHPDTNHPFIKKISENYNAKLHNQRGNNLGERMHNAISTSLQHYKKVILTGSDCPVLNADYINKAFKELEQHDMVMGPAEDGGYVLIGANKINTKLFKNINWSTSSVLQQSLINHKKENYKTHLLKPLWDIDTPNDYIKYQTLNIETR